MIDEMKLIMALCDALGFDVEMTATQNNRIGANQDVIKEYKLTKKAHVQVSDGEIYDIKDVFRSGGVLYWKDKQ